jgi:hypothetical protein
LAAGKVVCGAMEVRLGSKQTIMLRNSSVWPDSQGISAGTPVIFRILKLLVGLRTMKPFAPLITSNHVKGD